jgi:hypothetical protein
VGRGRAGFGQAFIVFEFPALCTTFGEALREEYEVDNPVILRSFRGKSRLG